VADIALQAVSRTDCGINAEVESIGMDEQRVLKIAFEARQICKKNLPLVS
jgi:hypothetical protein